MIEPGTAFVDHRGRTAQLHGIGIQQLGERYARVVLVVTSD